MYVGEFTFPVCDTTESLSSHAGSTWLAGDWALAYSKWLSVTIHYCEWGLSVPNA